MLPWQQRMARATDLEGMLEKIAVQSKISAFSFFVRQGWPWQLEQLAQSHCAHEQLQPPLHYYQRHYYRLHNFLDHIFFRPRSTALNRQFYLYCKLHWSRIYVRHRKPA